METAIFKRRIKKFIKRVLKPKFIFFLFPQTKPLSDYYGLDRGNALDRYYIESFLKKNSKYITGYCLEVLDNSYTHCYGRDIIKSDILDIDKNNTSATIHGDLRNLQSVPNETYNCIILTQVLQFIDDVPAAVRECHRILKSGGVLLATLPAISRIDCVAGVEGDYWRFTSAGARYIFDKVFHNVEVESWGNAKIGQYFWVGVAQEETCKKDLKYRDKNFPCVITVKALKS